MKPRKHVKTKITFQFMHELLGLDPEFHLDAVEVDRDRRLFELYLSSDANVHTAAMKGYLIGEGQSIPADTFALREFVDKMAVTLERYKRVIEKAEGLEEGSYKEL